jgi:hypothetical protein
MMPFYGLLALLNLAVLVLSIILVFLRWQERERVEMWYYVVVSCLCAGLAIFIAGRTP